MNLARERRKARVRSSVEVKSCYKQLPV